jgi:hypothetical protein
MQQPEALVGRRIGVLWPDDRQFYFGQIKEYREKDVSGWLLRALISGFFSLSHHLALASPPVRQAFLYSQPSG